MSHPSNWAFPARPQLDSSRCSCWPLVSTPIHLTEQSYVIAVAYARLYISWYMGVDALQGNGITRKLLYFLRDRALTPADEPLRKVRRSRILLFVAVQLVGFGATMAITQTIGVCQLLSMSYFAEALYAAAIGFPIVIMLLVPVRTYLVPRLPFTADELAILDGPTASPFVCVSPFI